MVLADFEHLKLATILSTTSLEYLVIIKEPAYPELVHYFYSNLTFQNNHVRSTILGKDINISLNHFAHLLHLSYEGVDIYNIDLMSLIILTVNLPSPHLFYFMMMKTLL